MLRRPPRSTRTDPLFPDTTLFRSGSCVMVTREGTRPLLVEVQALVDASPPSNPRRVAVGLEQNRLAMLLAVLHRHGGVVVGDRSEEHTSELQSLMRISYAVFCLKKKKYNITLVL